MAANDDLLGFDINDVEVISEPKNLSEVLNNLAAELVYCLQQTIDKENLIYKRELRDTVRMPVKLFDTMVVAELYMQDYYKFMDKGVRGIGGQRKSGKRKGEPWRIKAPNSPFQFKRGPKVSHIKEWANSKGLNEFAVRTTIAFEGLKPRYFYTDCVDESFTGELWNKHLKQFSVVTGKNITRQFKKGFKKK